MHIRSNRIALPAVVRAVVFALLSTSGLAATASSGEPGAPFGVDEVAYDRSQAEWSEAYLQWVASFARGNSPISDTTGALCGAKQTGEVWFLAMSDGTAPVERSCAIPAGKALFVPIATTVERSGNREPVCETMVRIAAGNLARVSQMSMTVDGRPVDDVERSHHVATGDCFALGLRQFPISTAKTAVADGYYVMLAPLSRGPHAIVVAARVDSTPISTTYHLDVQ